MAQFRDWAGWMETVEETEPNPEVEKKALRVVLSTCRTAGEAAEVAKALGIDIIVNDSLVRAHEHGERE